jgi:translation initiation factor IF-2
MNELQINPKVHKLIHTFLKDFEESAVNRKKSSIKGTEKGRATIANIFSIKGKKGTNELIYIPGIVVNSGKISKEHKLYIFRNGSPINTGLFAKNIKSFKKEVQ